MLIATTNDIPGRQVTEVLGEVMGLTVRSRNLGSQIGASFKSLVGGELKGMTKALVDSRHEVVERMVAEAQAKGADAILAMRFDTSEMGPNWTEICAYGTAVRTQALWPVARRTAGSPALFSLSGGIKAPGPSGPAVHSLEPLAGPDVPVRRPPGLRSQPC